MTESFIHFLTKPHRKPFRIKWTIENLSRLPIGDDRYLESPKFGTSDNKKMLSVQLFPRGSLCDPDTVSLYLQVHTYEQLHISFTASFLTPQDKKVYEKSIDDMLTSCSRIEGWSSFCSKSDLFDKTKNILSDDKLTILIKGEVTERSKQFTKQMSVQKDDTIYSDMKRMLLSSELSDVKLVVGGEGRIFNVHKVVLAARSPVFAAMFQHDMEESRTNTITIEDIESPIMEEVLNYMYTGEAPMLDLLSEFVLPVADRYQLEGLRTQCDQVLCSQLKIENAARKLDLADKHSPGSLKEMIVFFITSNAKEVLETEAWKELEASNPQLVKEVNTTLLEKHVLFKD